MLSLTKSRLSGKTLFFIFIFCFLSSFLHATIINVPTDQGTIQLGINAATNGDTVLVQPGTYVENINYNWKNITVGSLFLTTQDTSYISSTIIDGNSYWSVVTFENGENSTAVLCGFTITNGLAGEFPLDHGGGIYCLDSSPSLQNLTISGNSATSNGGGIYCYSSSPSLENVIIIGNSADYGGGIYCDLFSSPILQKVTISDNSAIQNGGGIYCEWHSTPVLINSILWNNSPQEIYIESGSVTATYSDIEGGWVGTGNIDSDPLFVDSGNGDYHLQASSPCIDAGDPASPLDPDGTIADMGAYYYNQYNGPIWHISTTGSDITGIGTEQYPFATIQHGINTSSDTDTVFVQSGTYVENINYNGKLITVASLFLTTQDTTYISSTIIDGNNSGRVVTFNSSEDSTAILCGFTVINGSADCGGGIYCYYSSPSLENLIISGNSASGTSGWGGGFFCYGSGSNPSLENLTIIGNSAIEGGGIFCYNGSSSLQNVTITGNTATLYGGGGICFISSYSSSLQNVTITDNSAAYGGGIYCYQSHPSLINSILWNNSPQEITLGYLGLVTATYSDIEGGWTGTGNIDSDPLFVDPANGDYHLQSTSPCIDAGDPASPLDPDGTIADMGAYYFHQIFPPDADFTADTTNGDVPLTVNFIDISTQGTGVIDEWYWDFGDGNNSSLQDPANEYLLPGNYTVSLTVTDVNDSTDNETKVDYITVNPPAYNGPIWHISTTGSDVSGNGSEQYPFATIQHGINTSTDTDTVLVQPGTYVENINYNGKLITVGSLFITTQDTTHISSTYIDGDSTESVVTFNNGEDSTTVLCGFTITNGLGGEIYPDHFGGGITCKNLSNPILENLIITSNYSILGGGIYCDNSSPSLENLKILENSAYYGGGGGICCQYNSSPSMQNLTISGNSAVHGGGIYCDNSSPSLLNMAITSNSAVLFGGGIYCHDSSPSLENVTISGNSANDSSGGIYCCESSPSLVNVTISGNSAIDYGGGIWCYESSPSLVNVTISGNSASYGGGICCQYNSSPSLQNLTISGNSADCGGGICCWGSNPALDNITISGNSAIDYGGGIWCYGSSPSLENVTITGNSSGQLGGGFYCWHDISEPVLKNSILWNDSPQEIYIESGSVTVTYSDIQGEWIGLGNIDSDPLFVDDGNGDYHLQSISPCINTGDPLSPLDPDGTRADMGAYYFHQIPIAAEFTSNVNNGYSPLSVSFTDLSTQGAGVIDEWYWDFGDGESSSVQNPSHTFYELGYYTISLTVTDENDSTDTEIKTDYIAVSADEQPAAPANVNINMIGNDVVLNWDEVNTSIYGNFVFVDYYLIYGSDNPYCEFIFLSAIPDTSFTQNHVAAFNDKMFYQVTSYIGELRFLQSVITENPNLKLGELDLLIEEKRLRINKSFRYLNKK